MPFPPRLSRRTGLLSHLLRALIERWEALEGRSEERGWWFLGEFGERSSMEMAVEGVSGGKETSLSSVNVYDSKKSKKQREIISTIRRLRVIRF